MTTSTTERAQQTAATGAEEAKRVAGTAASEAKSVAGEAAQQARGVVNDAVGQVRGQLDDQGRQQKERLAGTLSTFGDDLGRMAENYGVTEAALAAYKRVEKRDGCEAHGGQRKDTRVRRGDAVQLRADQAANGQ